MDLALSPDWPAQYCYLIVLVIGFVVASLQVERLFQGFPLAWVSFSTWLLFSFFLLLPVVLFWFLDRTNTLHDTSLFGAILVAVAYRQIFVGGVDKVNVPGQVSRIWERLMKWADERARRIRERKQANADAFDQKVVSRLTFNPEQRQKVIDLLKFYAGDFESIQTEMEALEKKWAPLGTEVGLHKAAEFLYRKLRLETAEKFTDLMYREKLISWIDYYWYGKELRSRAVQFLVTVALLIACLYFFYQAVLNPMFQVNYHVFRLTKPNTTPDDRSRTRRELTALIATGETAPHICDQLTGALRYDPLPVETAERVLSVLLEHRASVCLGDKRSLPRLLTNALRAENPDVRMRIHNALLFLAGERGGQIEQALNDWKPAKNESAADVERKIRNWYMYWDATGSRLAQGNDNSPVAAPEK